MQRIFSDSLQLWLLRVCAGLGSLMLMATLDSATMHALRAPLRCCVFKATVWWQRCAIGRAAVQCRHRRALLQSRRPIHSWRVRRPIRNHLVWTQWASVGRGQQAGVARVLDAMHDGRLAVVTI